jgi:hypothetical protein
LATLNNKKIKDTFKGLLKTLDNAEITGQVEITDGDGNQTGVFINTDGSIKVTGTTEFGSLKDTGEDITITKFVDEADGISNNDDDSSIPTSGAVKDYVDSGVNTNAANISTNTSNISTNTSDISTNTGAISLNTAKNSYPSADAAKVANISVTQAVDLDTLESNVATNNSKVSFDSTSSSKLSGIEAGAQVNDVTSVNGQTGSVTLTSSNVNEGTNLYYTDSRVASNSAVAANTAKTGITDAQASAINANTSKVGITTQQADAIVANTAKTGITTEQANAITANTAKVGITTKQASDITTNNSKVSFPEAPNDGDSYVRKNEGWESLTHPTDAVTSVNGETGVVVLDSDDITEGTSNLYYTDERVSSNSDVTANTAKVGITTQQASDITTNNAKVGITTQQAADIVANNSKVGITTQQASDITTNNAKVGITTTQADAITANTAKVGITTEQTNAITANTAKVGITTQQASDITTNNAKVGITTQQASDITTNNSKESMVLGTTAGTALEGNTSLLQLGTTSTTALAGDTTIPDNNNQLTNGAGYTTNTGTVTEVTVGTGLDVTNGTSTPALSLDLSEFTDMTADMIETDEFIVLDGGAERRKAINEIKSTLFSNNDLYKVIGIATDHASRVTLDSGTSEGATSIMQNFEILIAN